MKKLHLIFSIWMVLPLLTIGQPKKIKSFKADNDVTATAVDRAGDFYLVLRTGEIQKFDKNGTKIASFKGTPDLTTFDPTNAIRLLAFYQADKKYTWLSPSLEDPGFQEIDPSWAIDPMLICPSGDHYLWILDAADWSLKKINPQSSQTLADFIISKPIPHPEIARMREYLNFIFLLDVERGFFIFNAMGKLIHKIEVKDISNFNFLGEELYYQKENTIHFFDLYTAEKRILQLAPKDYHWVILTDERMFTVQEENEVEILEYTP
ncbi:MAG: hypothetical protein C0523_01585 [Cytophaga sp.]|nr:hypothetical protein [Cytophaga sp.]